MRNKPPGVAQLSTRGRPDDPYRLETVARACGLLRAFEDKEELRLCEIVRRTGLDKTIVFRLLHTLRSCGVLERHAGGRYTSKIRFVDQRTFRIGYAAQAEESTFSAAVTSGLWLAAKRAGLELIVLDNRFSPTLAIKSASRLVRERVDLAVEFQTYERIAPVISQTFLDAGIPLIAVEIPHPGATFYGANNYLVGLTAGRLLGRWTLKHWGGKVDYLLFLTVEAAGPVPGLRVAGAEAGLREVLSAHTGKTIYVETYGVMERAFEATRKCLQRLRGGRTLITGVNDPSVLGALRAFEEAGRAHECAAFGLGAFPEARAELRRPSTRLLGTIAFFPERYGDDIIQLALAILHRRHVPPAVYTRHEVVTPQNINKIYPLDTREIAG